VSAGAERIICALIALFGASVFIALIWRAAIILSR
jgi:hypothetical protein